MPTCKNCFTHNSYGSVICACGAELTTHHNQTNASSTQNKIIDENPHEQENFRVLSVIVEKLLLITILGFCLWGTYLLLTGGL